MLVLRGISRATAAVTGLLLIYGISYALEGMTTRIPEIPLHEFARSTLWLLPWTLLFCSGLDDLAKTTRQAWVFWAGVTLGIALLLGLEHYTGDGFLSRIAVPVVGIVGGSLPHFIRRIRFIYTVACLMAGVLGLVVSYFAGPAFFYGRSFATRTIAFLVATFIVSSIATAGLTATSLRSAKSR